MQCASVLIPCVFLLLLLCCVHCHFFSANLHMSHFGQCFHSLEVYYDQCSQNILCRLVYWFIFTHFISTEFLLLSATYVRLLPRHFLIFHSLDFSLTQSRSFSRISLSKSVQFPVSTTLVCAICLVVDAMAMSFV